MGNVIKKIILWIVGVILAIIVVGFVVVQLLPGLTDRVKSVAVDGSNCWMAGISDDVLLSEMSIPGVHDFGSRNVQLALFSKCQDRTAKQLLNDGFRYLDIRLGVEYVKGEPVMSLYHGFTHCLSGTSVFSGHLMLDEIIKDCTDFLTENPSETILFVVKKEHGDESIAEFQRILNTYTTDAFLLTDSMPTLGEARGKIVLIRRYEDEAGLGCDSGIYLTWSQQKANDDVTLTYELVEGKSTQAYVQDRYKYDTDDKWNAFVSTVNETEQLIKRGVVINFLSTNGTPTYGHPYKYAKKLNAKFLTETFTGNLGWVVVDFGNAKLAQKIYTNN